MSSTVRERAEVFANRIVLTHLVAYLFKEDPKMVRSFRASTHQTVDQFQFVDGWQPQDEARVRRYLREYVDQVIGPAAKSVRR
jgi:hypothetical protein